MHTYTRCTHGPRVVKKSLEPVWDEEFEIEVDHNTVKDKVGPL
jgi:Ca2+-dependent lipid-binding protein